MASLAAVVPLSAQNSADWLSGEWIELVKPAGRSKGKVVAGPAGTLQVAIGNGMLRIVENGAEGEDLRCRLDGTESVYRQTKTKATVDYMLECEIGSQSVEITGLFTAGRIEGFPPREFELRKKYELTKDGSVLKQDQMWGIIPGLGRIGLADTTTRFSRKK